MLAAVANDDEAPSVLFGLADGPAPDALAAPPNALRPLVGHLRRTLVTATGQEREDAAAALARLAAAGVPGASPDDWWGLAAATTEGPLQPDPDEPVHVSPSKLERFEESQLDWFAERIGGGESMLSSAIGTMLHWVLETATAPDPALLLAALEGRWRELDFEAAWIGEREHRLAERMIGSIAAYLRSTEAEGWTAIGGETPFEFRVGRALARGSIDRIERGRDGVVRVVDLKTGSTRVSAKEAPTHAQLGVYQLAVADGAVETVPPDAPSGGAALLYVRSKSKRPFDLVPQGVLDEAAAQEFRDRLQAAAEGMAGAEFEGTVEPRLRHGQAAFRPWLLRVPEVCGG